MPGVVVEIDEGQVAAIERMLTGINRGIGKVMSRAINKVAKKARTRITRGLHPLMPTLKLGDIRKKIRIDYAGYTKWFAAVGISRRLGPALTPDEVIQAAGGVHYQKLFIAHAFVGKLKSGHAGVYRRASISGGQVPAVAGNPGPLVRRLPIKPVRQLSLADQYYGAAGLAESILQQTQVDFAREVRTQAEVLIRQEDAKSGKALAAGAIRK